VIVSTRFRVASAAALGMMLSAARAFPAPTPAPGTVGFKTLFRVDGSRRVAPHADGRPLQVSIWYPASAGGRPMSARDYLLLAATETTPGRATRDAERKILDAYRKYLAGASVSTAQADAILATRMRAHRDAAPASGTFPLVLIAQGNGEGPYDQAFLAELLAGRGYVVATTPSQSRIGGPMRGEADIPAHASEEAQDLAFVAAALRDDPSVRRGGIGLVGYSFGARSALLFEMRDRDVAAFVSLDGGIGSKTGQGQLEKAPGFDPKRAQAPLLHVYEEGDRFMPVDLNLVQSLDRCDRWLVRVEGMRHTHFSSMGLFVASVPELARITQATPRTGEAWKAAAEATAAFLDRFVAHPRPDPPAAWTPPRSSVYTTRQLPAFGRAPAAAPPRADSGF
jgi:dienelactone hydrolase